MTHYSKDNLINVIMNGSINYMLPNSNVYPIKIFGVECGGGWTSNILSTLFRIEAADINKIVLVNQIKEKFGGIRFYWSFRDDIVDDNLYKTITDIVKDLEHECLHTCEVCGERDGVTTASNNNWIITLCPECRSRR